MLVASIALIANSAYAQKLKIATVDMDKLFKDYHVTAVEKKKHTHKFAIIQKENNERLSNIRTLEDQLDQLRKQIEDPSLNDSVKKEKHREFRKKLDDAKALDRERRDFLNRRTKALELEKRASMQGILEEIRKRIVDHSKKEDFDFVLDKSGMSTNMVPFLLYTKESSDITEALLKELNKDAPQPPATEATPAPEKAPTPVNP